MHPALRARLAVQDQVFTSADALACGYDAHSLARLVRSEDVVRVRRGAYIAAEALVEATPERRHALRTSAIWRSFGPSTTLVPSHQSAQALHGLPIHGTKVDEVHMARTRPSNTRRSSGLSIGPALRPEAFTTEGQPLVIPAVAIVQTAATYGLDAGVTAADPALRNGQVTPEGLARALDLARLGPGADLARATVRLADGRSESVGESRSRVLFAALGLPEPELQVELHDAAGLAGRVDFLFRRQRTIVEFDGLEKYAGADGRRALAREKHREDRLRALGYEVVRLVWSDLSHPERVWRLVQSAFARAAARTAS